MFFTLFFFLLTHQEGRKCDLALGQYVAKILIIHQVVALEAQILCHYLLFPSPLHSDSCTPIKIQQFLRIKESKGGFPEVLVTFANNKALEISLLHCPKPHNSQHQNNLYVEQRFKHKKRKEM